MHNMMVAHCIQNKEIISDEFYEYAHDLEPVITNTSVTSKEGKPGLFYFQKYRLTIFTLS